MITETDVDIRDARYEKYRPVIDKVKPPVADADTDDL